MLTIGDFARLGRVSVRMLRHYDAIGLLRPERAESNGYRRYGPLELNQLRSLRELRRSFGVGIDELAFVVRLQREPGLQAAVATWLAGTQLSALDWEQRKHERLLAA